MILDFVLCKFCPFSFETIKRESYEGMAATKEVIVGTNLCCLVNI